jgi:hypothetical protein
MGTLMVETITETYGIGRKEERKKKLNNKEERRSA